LIIRWRLVAGKPGVGFGRFFTDAGRVTFGKWQAMTGRAAIEAGVKHFFGTIRGWDQLAVGTRGQAGWW